MVKIAADVLGMSGDMTVVAADTNDPDDNLRQQNPLGKVPALLVGDDVIYDTRVILDYFDQLYTAKHGTSILYPGEGMEIIRLKTALARVIGMLDAGILIVYEGRFRPENMRVESFVDYQLAKVTRSFAEIKAENPTYTNGATPTAADIALACALDHYDYRKQLDWRDHCPSLASWMMDFSNAVPSYKATLPDDIAPAEWR
jgi:glutathione S-transferase